MNSWKRHKSKWSPHLSRSTCRRPLSKRDCSWLEIWSQWEYRCRRHGNMHKEEVKSRGNRGGKLIWAVLQKSTQHERAVWHIKTSFRAYMKHRLHFCCCCSYRWNMMPSSKTDGRKMIPGFVCSMRHWSSCFNWLPCCFSEGKEKCKEH